jgi:hypothetical protein
MFLIEALVGGGLIVFGRRLFWFLVAGIGFAVGLELVSRYLQSLPAWEALLVALGAGLVGALLAVFLEQAAIALVGFIGGAYILVRLFNLLGDPFRLPSWVIGLIGGILGVILIFVLFDWTLILLSSLVGASMVTQAFQLHNLIGILVYSVLVVVGIVIQSRGTRPARRPSRR